MKCKTINRRRDRELGLCSLATSRLCEARSTVSKHAHGCLLAPRSSTPCLCKTATGKPINEHGTLFSQAKLCKAEKACSEVVSFLSFVAFKLSN